MASLDARLGAIKSSLSAGSVSAATTVDLQSLLNQDTTPSGPIEKAGSTRRKAAAESVAKPKRDNKATTARSKISAPVAVREDISESLSSRDKYALATHAVNSGLKFLSDTLKDRKKAPKTSNSTSDDTPSTPGPARPLQPRSGNTTPGRPSPVKQDGAKSTSNSRRPLAEDASSSSLVCAAACVRSGFAFLRSAEAEQLGIRKTSPRYLETGMLAMISKLMAHGLDEMAIRELRIVKQCLEHDSSSGSSKNGPTAERETIASLLHLRRNFDADPEAIPVAITYQMNVLKVIAKASKPQARESCVKYLQSEEANSPANLILQHAKHSGDSDRAPKQLESLSQTVLGLCPSISTANDEVALDPRRSPSPRAVFDLQTLALRIRNMWWDLAQHKPDVTKELLDPFLKCSSAFVRRCSGEMDAIQVYDLLKTTFESLKTSQGNKVSCTLGSIHEILYTQADKAGLYDEAGRLAQVMSDNCSDLQSNHVKRASSLLRKCIAGWKSATGQVDDATLLEAHSHIHGDMHGGSSDYDVLLSALAAFMETKAACMPDQQNSINQFEFERLAARFALRYFRSYTPRGTNHVRAILDACLRSNKGNDVLLEWVTADAATVFIQSGTLEAVASAANSKPVASSWSSSHDAIMLGRIIHALGLKSVKSGHSSLGFDTETLDSGEKGVVLELQLQQALELTAKPKYHDFLRKSVSEILRGLSSVYTASEHPIRRSRVVSLLYKLREVQIDMIPPHSFKVWNHATEIEEEQLGRDVGLQPYLVDVKTNLAVARAFSDGSPSVEGLQTLLFERQKIIDQCTNLEALSKRVEDPTALSQQLQSIAAYFGMLGDNAACLQIQQALLKLAMLSKDIDGQVYHAAAELSRTYIEMGHSEKAEEVQTLARSTSKGTTGNNLARIHYLLSFAEFLLATDKLEQCEAALEEARQFRLTLTPDKIARDQRRSYERLHAYGWLIQSKFMLESSAPHEALAAARSAVKMLNTTWASLERASGRVQKDKSGDQRESPESNINSLAKGVSKLQLTPKDPEPSSEPNKKGAAFWPFIPLLCKALMHLSDMYAHHGIFNEANYYSERAVEIAESSPQSALQSSVKTHRSQLLTLAGQTEDAELCLVQSEAYSPKLPSLLTVEQHLARGALRAKEDSLEQTKTSLEEARLCLESYSAASLARSSKNPDSLECGEIPVSRARITRKPEAPTKVSTQPAKTSQQRKPTTSTVATAKQPGTGHYLLDKLMVRLLLGQVLLKIRLDECAESKLREIETLRPSGSALLLQRIAQSSSLVKKATLALETDVTLNVLTESTLAFPAIVEAQSKPSADSASAVAAPKTKTSKAVPRTAKKKAPAGAPSEDDLNTARGYLIKDLAANFHAHGTAHTYGEYAILSSASLLASAMHTSMAKKTLNPALESLAIDMPRVKALQFEQQAGTMDNASGENAEPFAWPETNTGVSLSIPSAAEYQEQYIDILPSSWTAVSLCLNEDGSELYAVRYCAGQAPLTLRLPFSRQSSEDIDEEPFDYHMGKAELKDIIEMSNHTCHNTKSLEIKGAKTAWWNERESLDRRLHELLVNIENIWFGGFKGVLSQQARQPDLLARFRKAFDTILDRYLPSRKIVKGKTAVRLDLDDKVLELLTGLGNDQDGTVDLDEPIADLLYFVVDMLQFNGERNAYDEIDFDSMAVDVLDALRTYQSEPSPSPHLILVLEKRLQAFPWESMPCLENASVSRVGSMLTLRECILEMRRQQDAACHTVSRNSGTYIVNPSSDLPSTQATLTPALSALSAPSWDAIVATAPTEQRFSAALSSSAITLYFGHGAGAQYIRPRAVRRLQRCSEVVWLMGCSSGAVREYGELEPAAVPLAYLLAGTQQRKAREEADQEKLAEDGGAKGVGNGSGKCLAVLATLWDVTDKDIDRFSLAVGEDWGLFPTPNETVAPQAKKSKKREFAASGPPTTPGRPPKTPAKTPRACKTPAKTPARSRSVSKVRGGEGKGSLVRAVARSRESCYLRYLNGAAPVVYGVPVYLGD